MKRILAEIAIFLSCALPLAAQGPVFNRAPLEATFYAELPLGSIRPQGWLSEQLRRQAEGLTGHLDEIYPEVMGENNAWLGGDGDAWERGPYWIDGLLPLAYILDDPSLKEKAGRWVEAMLSSQQEDGYFGPAEDHPFVYGLQRGSSHDWWPKMVALKILKQYYMASGDPRVIDLMLNYFRYQKENLPDLPLDHWTSWGRWRGGDNLEVVLWLYDITGEDFLLDLAAVLHSQTAPWTDLFTDGSVFSVQNSLHCVNLAQGFKEPTVWWQYSHSEKDKEAPVRAVEAIRHTIGLPTGLWAGDELIHFASPTRGSELCTAVEMMFSLEEMLRISGDIRWADYLERVAYNALPTQVDDAFMNKQYYQQTNQIACTRDWRPFSTPHDDVDNLFGTLNGYPCCLSNMHQGWPKFTQNLWYATADGGLAALVYAPCEVKSVLGGKETLIREITYYPFDDSVWFQIDFTGRKVRKASFPLHFRIPGWSGTAEVSVNGEILAVEATDGIVVLDREWHKGDLVRLRFDMEVRTEEWFDKAWSVVRGPLLFALPLDEKKEWTEFSGRDRYYGKGAFELTTDTKWNYCLMRDEFSLDSCVVCLVNGGGARTWTWPWNLENAPVSISVPARELPHWKAYGGSVGEIAYFTEDGNDAGEKTTLRLIPYGCTTLRIAAFPTRIIPWDLEYRETY